LLPTIGGLEFLEQLRAKPVWATLPVVIVSGDPTKLLKVEGLPHVGALSKPFDASVLIAAVAHFLEPTALTQPA
jgi:CheY-like chemotaxis protein